MGIALKLLKTLVIEFPHFALGKRLTLDLTTVPVEFVWLCTNAHEKGKRKAVNRGQRGESVSGEGWGGGAEESEGKNKKQKGGMGRVYLVACLSLVSCLTHIDQRTLPNTQTHLSTRLMMSRKLSRSLIY